MFNNLMSKIFGHAGSATSTTQAPPSTTIESATAPSATTPAASPVSPATAAPAATPDPAAAPVQAVDVTAILDGLAAKNSEKLDWKKSIVDLLKLLDMDSSISARKQLATELHYTGDENYGSTNRFSGSSPSMAAKFLGIFSETRGLSSRVLIVIVLVFDIDAPRGRTSDNGESGADRIFDGA
jgi:hypothetical protein